MSSRSTRSVAVAGWCSSPWELVDGPDLREWLGIQSRPWFEVLDRIVEAGRGLAAAHGAGLVHGDVKPGNMIVGQDGRLRIADFGLAWGGFQREGVCARRASPPSSLAAVELAMLARLVATSVEREFVAGEPRDGLVEELERSELLPRPVGGTWAYMAPECLEGREEQHVRADLYSLCATAWEALFGARPYAGNNAEALLAAIARGRLERGHGRPKGMPRAVVGVLQRGLSVDMAHRWPSVEELLRELERARLSRWWWPTRAGAQLRPSQSRLAQPRPGQPRPSQSRPSQSRPSQSRPSQSRPSQSRPSQSRPSQSRPSQPRRDAPTSR